jgi:hypothetical protein
MPAIYQPGETIRIGMGLRRPVRLAGGGADPYPGLVVYDTFTDTNGVGLDAHTPELSPSGGLWTEHAGAWDIQSGRANLTDSLTGVRLATIESGIADCDIATIVRWPSALDNPSVAFRYVDDNNFLLAVIADAGDVIRLIRKLNGTPTALFTSASFPTVVNTDYVLEVIANGTSVKIYLDGSLALDVTCVNFVTATRHGIYCERQYTKFDDFQVARL